MGKPSRARERSPVESLIALREDLSAVFRNPSLGDREKRVLVAMMMLINSWGKDEDRLSVDQIAAYVGIDERNTRRVLRDLEQRGYVGSSGGGAFRGDVPRRWVYVAAIRGAAPALPTGNELESKGGQTDTLRGADQAPYGGLLRVEMGGRASPPPVHPSVTVQPCMSKGGQVSPPYSNPPKTARPTAALENGKQKQNGILKQREEALAVFDRALNFLSPPADGAAFTRSLARNLWPRGTVPYDGLIRILAKVDDWRDRVQRPAKNKQEQATKQLAFWLNPKHVRKAIETGADFFCSDSAHERAKCVWLQAEAAEAAHPKISESAPQTMQPQPRRPAV